MKKYLLLTTVIVSIIGLIISGCTDSTPSPAVTPAPALAPALAPAPAPGSAPAPTAKPAPAPSPAVKPVELRFAYQNAPTARTAVKFHNPWAKKIEEATKGRIKVTVFPAEGLCKTAETIDAIKGGIADLAFATVDLFAGRFPLTGIFALPFSALPTGHLNGKEVGMAPMNSRILQEWYETSKELQAEWTGIKVLLLATPGPNQIMTAKKPVRNQQDLKGLRLVVRAGAPSETMKLLGVSPMNLPSTDIYESAQKGVIDGTTGPVASMLSTRLYEVFKYRTLESPLQGTLAWMMNIEKWNSLPTDVQQSITSVSGMSAVDMWTSEVAGPSEDADAEAQMKKAGFSMEVVKLDVGEWDKWLEIGGKPVWDKYLADLQTKKLPGKLAFDQLAALREKYK